MINCNEINEYIEYVKNNPDEINEERKQLIENVVIPILKRTDIVFDKEVFDKCISFCERRYYKLFPYQKFIYAFVFMYEGEDKDIPLFRTFFIMMGRGNGKDGAFAPLMSFLTTHYHGIQGYNIDIVANGEEQAQDTFDVVYNMLEENKKAMKKYFYWNKTQIINKSTHSKIRFNTSNPKTKDGKKTGAILFNEYHQYENAKQIKVFRSGLGKIKYPRIFIITTEGEVRDGPLDEMIDISNKVLKKEYNIQRVFPFICKLNKKEDAHEPMKKFLKTNNHNDIDLTKWCQANPSLRFMKNLQEEIIMHYIDSLTSTDLRVEFFTKRMNVHDRNPEAEVTSWDNVLRASYSDIENRIERETPDLEGMLSVVGIDFASINDFASAGFLFYVNGEYIWRKKTWVCANSPFFNNINFPLKNAGEEELIDFEIVYTDTIDEREIVKWIIEEMPKYRVRKIIMDNYKFTIMKRAFEEYGLDIESKKNPNGLVRMIRYPASIAAIYGPKIEKEFAEGNINIGASKMMRWSIGNTCVVRKKDGNMNYEKVEPKLRKNDPFMAFVCAMSGESLLERRIIYV